MLALLFSLTAAHTAMASAKAGELSIYEGKTGTISLASAYQRTLRQATSVTYQWYSENSSYVAVTGSTKYYATIKGLKATKSCKVYFKCSYFIDGFFRTMDFYYTVEVEGTSVKVTSVKLSDSSMSLTEGTKQSISATAYPTNATNRNVNWSSSNSSVATYSNGYVVAKSAGTATITCTAADGSGCYATCKVTVNAAPIYVSKITLNKTSDELLVGGTSTLKATVSPTYATKRDVNWKSSNTSVATVSNGFVTAKSVGTATITCTAADGSGCYATCKITVKPATVDPTGVTLDKTSYKLPLGDTLRLTAEITPSNATDKTITWTSSDPTVADVSEGVVTAKSVGTANIIATTSNNHTAVCVVEVFEEETGEVTDWSGNFIVASSHVENNPTRDYPDNFGMTIEEVDGIFYITSMLGEDLTKYNNGGFKLNDNGDGTATVDVSYYNTLRYTGKSNPIYVFYVYDETAEDWTDTWTLKMNDDGTIKLGEFYVAAFTWVESESKWGNGQLEALYYSMNAKKGDATGISKTEIMKSGIRISNGSVLFDEAADVTVHKDNGILVYSGCTNRIDNLPKGIYVVRMGNQSKKILVK